MATFKTSDNDQMIITCSCSCDEGLRVQIDNDDNFYCYQTYLSANWCKKQKGFLDKLRKIWHILINRDYFYSEICLTKEDWEEYKTRYGGVNIMEYIITFTWDNEANVWIATSQDIPGLVLESGSFDTLLERTRFAIPELLELNASGSHPYSLIFKSERHERMVI